MLTNAARCLIILKVLTLSSVAGIAGESDVTRRVGDVSATYLKRPYVLGPLGEGAEGDVSTKPLADETRFDCTTYVETVLARTLARSPEDFACILRNIRYQDGQVDFLDRLHLPDSEWLPHQQQLGILRDVTAAAEFKTYARVVEATVNRADWLKRLGPADVKKNVTPAEKVELAAALHRRADDYTPQRVRLDYLPLEALQQAELTKLLPSGAVFNVVRRSPRWIVRGRVVRVEALISHQGFLIRKGDQVYVRSATMLKDPRNAADVGGRVRDIRLDDYVTYLSSIKDPKSGEGNILGLNILLPQARPPGLCP